MRSRSHIFLGGLAVATLALLLAVWRLSPYVYASALQTAVATSELSTIVRLIDIETVRRDLTEASIDSLPASMRLAGGQVLSPKLRALVGKYFKLLFIDRMVMPERIASLLRGEGAFGPDVRAQIPEILLTKRTMTVERGYGETSDIFLIRYVSKETAEEAALVMRRNGWFGWRVIAIRFSPSYALMLPILFSPGE